MHDPDNVVIEIKNVYGEGEEYDAWTVEALGYIDEKGEKKHEKTLKKVALKGRGYFKSEGEEASKILKVLKEMYVSILREDLNYKEHFSKDVEEERQEVRKNFEGKKFDL